MDEIKRQDTSLPPLEMLGGWDASLQLKMLGGRDASLQLKMLEVLKSVLVPLPNSIEKELDRWGRGGRFIGNPLVERYRLDSRVSLLLVKRVEAMLEALRTSSCTKLRASSQGAWKEIGALIGTGKEGLSPHGRHWVILCWGIEQQVLASD